MVRTTQTEQTTRRFRVCQTCGEQFSMARAVRNHQNTTGHDGVDHITAVVQE